MNVTERLRFTAVFERDEDGWIAAHVPELPEVNTQGRTLEEAREMVRDAVEFALQLRRKRGEPIPETGWVLAEPVEIDSDNSASNRLTAASGS